MFFFFFLKKKKIGNIKINPWRSMIITLLRPLAISLSTLIKGVAPIPRPINKTISYLEWSCEAEP